MKAFFTALLGRQKFWKFILVTAMVAVIVYLFSDIVHTVLAEDGVAAGATRPLTPPGGETADSLGGIGQAAGNVVAGLATLLIKLLAGILWFVLFWMGDLMDNTFILEGEIGEKLRSVWIIVRNFVNIFFALALVIVAFLSVIGYGDESGNYGMKKFIPKMALALIAVNFTFLACRIVLDVNNVITTAIFAIPQGITTTEIGPTGTAGVETFTRFKCLQAANLQDALRGSETLERTFPGVINNLGAICFADIPSNTPEAEGARLRAEGINGQRIIPMGSEAFTKKDFVWTMATQFQGLHNLNKVSQLTEKTFAALTVNALFSILFAIIYGVAYIAMFIILLARVVVLWICIMLSPLAAVAIVLPDLLPDDLNITKKFLAHAFVPAKMAVPLAFGYILISQMSIAINTESAIFQGGLLDLSQSGEFARGASITTLMYGIASVAVIWMGVFMASKDVVGAEFVGKIKSYAESAGETVLKWPAYLPIIPMPGGAASFQTLTTGYEQARNRIEEIMRTSDRRRADQWLSEMGIPTSRISEAMGEIERMIQSQSINPETLRSQLRTIATDASSDGEVKTVLERISTQGAGMHSEEQQRIATVMGYRDFQQFQNALREPAEITRIRESLRAGGTTPAAPGAGTGAVQLGTLDPALRTSLGVISDRSINLTQTSPEQFIAAIGDIAKVNDQTLRSIVQHTTINQQLGISTNEPTKAGLNNNAFLTRLKTIILHEGTDAARETNRSIRALYMTVTGHDDAQTNTELNVTPDGMYRPPATPPTTPE